MEGYCISTVEKITSIEYSRIDDAFIIDQILSSLVYDEKLPAGILLRLRTLFLVSFGCLMLSG